MTISQYRKEISPDYEWINSKRRRLVGYTAQLIDADGTIIYSTDHSTYHGAEIALDQRVYDLLNDQPPAAPVCTMNVLGTHWTICGASSDGPCMCDVVIKAAPVCSTCAGEGDCPDCDPLPDLATDLYNVVCLTLSGAAATTAISELRRVQARYERERNTDNDSPLARWRKQGEDEQARIAKLHL